MRALHVNPGNLYGGVETMLVTLAREAASTPDVSTSFGVCFEGRFSRELEALGQQVHRLGPVRLRRPTSVLRARRQLAARLLGGTADVVVCHQAWSYAVMGPAARRAKVPVVLWLHTVDPRRHWLERWAHRRTPHMVIANSRYTATAAATAFPGVPVETVYCPSSVPPPEVGLQSESRARIRASAQTSDRDVVIAQVGRLEALKGHRIAIEALAQLRDVPGWTYWVVGGPQRSGDTRVLVQLEALARTVGVADRVRFLGEREDVPRVLRAADIYCQPNTGAESFGLSLVEAMAAGLPVVTSALGGALEIVDDSCGVLTPAGDERAVAAALRRLVIHPDERGRLREGARLRPDQLCNPARQMRRIQEALTRVAGASAHATAS